MPCDEVRMISQVLKAENSALLKQALTTLKCWVNIRLTRGEAIVFTLPNGHQGRIVNGVMTVEAGDERYINQIKRAYSVAVLEEVASQFSWTLVQESEHQLVIEKGTF